MKEQKFDNPDGQAEPEERPGAEKKVDPDELNKVKLLFKYFDSAFSVLKLYPPGNPSIAKTVGIFDEKLKEFLEEYDELRVGIGEFNFKYKDEIAFQDEEKKRSLPFFLFKDGMRELSFFKGLDSKELQYFLDILKEALDLPSEESDAVSLLWEKDFVNIRYYALDEFLDLKIGGGDKAKDFEIDPGKFKSGKIELTPEDIEEFKNSQDMLMFTQKKEGEGEGDREGPLSSDSRIPVLTPEEAPEIEKLLDKERQINSEGELVGLLFEILYFEENDEQFANVLKMLEKYFLEIVRKADFPHALEVLKNVHGLKENLRDKSEEKIMLLDKFEKNAKDESFNSLLKKLYLDEKVKDYDSFFRCLELMGPEVVSVVGIAWENAKDMVHKHRAADILREIGKKDVGALLYFAKASNVSLSLEIISMMEAIGDLKELHHFEGFVGHPNKDIQLEVIRVLGKMGSKDANKILVRFLADKDVEVTAFAARNIKYLGDQEVFEFLLELAKDKEFLRRTRVEKNSMLNYLASAKNDEAYSLFRSILKKWSLFSAAKQNELRFCVVSALEAQPSPQAREVLQEGTKVFGRSVRQACRVALSQMEHKAEPLQDSEGDEGI